MLTPESSSSAQGGNEEFEENIGAQSSWKPSRRFEKGFENARDSANPAGSHSGPPGKGGKIGNKLGMIDCGLQQGRYALPWQ